MDTFQLWLNQAFCLCVGIHVVAIHQDLCILRSLHKKESSMCNLSSFQTEKVCISYILTHSLNKCLRLGKCLASIFHTFLLPDQCFDIHIFVPIHNLHQLIFNPIHILYMFLMDRIHKSNKNQLNRPSSFHIQVHIHRYSSHIQLQFCLQTPIHNILHCKAHTLS